MIMCKLDFCKKVKFFCFFALILIIVAVIIFLGINVPNMQKDIFVAVARTGDNTAVGNAIINFSENQIEEGNAISHTPGTSEIMINDDGIYQISYQLTGVVLTEDIVNNRYTLTATVILRLSAGDTLQLGALSLEDVTYPNARIDIEKIG